jgi:hypothetical protein
VKVVQADMSSEGAMDPICMELADLCSTAVDFPKTGVPAGTIQVYPADRCRFP